MTVRAIAAGTVALILGGLALLWGFLFLSFHITAGEPWRLVILAAFGFGGAVLILALFTSWRRVAALLLIGALAVPVGWFLSLTPQNEADWIPANARMVTGSRDGDRLTLSNVRNFLWQTPTSALERWETRSYDLSALKSVDLYMVHWGSPLIAHTVISFGFSTGDFLAWSIEVRYRQGQTYNPLAGLFRTSEVIFIAGDERDIIRRGVAVDNEDIWLYRLQASPDRARELLLTYIEDANALARTPIFYNTLTTNCTTLILRMARAIGVDFPFDWRMIVNGYLPEWLHRVGALNQSMPIDKLRAASNITDRARTVMDKEDFSRLIREGLPGF